jgi:SpoVK/Ycf46/Vps4 family AAA+-type ATPase
VYSITIDRNDDRPIFVRRDVKTDGIVSLQESITKSVIKEIETFWGKEKLFKSYGFLHRRGYLFYGPQGTGKSSVVKQIMEDVVRRGGLVFLCDNPKFLNQALITLRQAEPERQLVCVFEDIDAIIAKYGEDDLLAVLDGANMVDHVLNIACPDPDMPILMADLTWKRAGDLAVGEEIIAFDEENHPEGFGRRLQTAKVLQCPIIQKPRYRVTTDKNEVIVSENHPFLIRVGNKPYEWRKVQDLQPNCKIVDFGRPWETFTSHDAGYVAGQFDGEGCLNSTKNEVRNGLRVTWHQVENISVSYMEKALIRLGFKFNRYRREMNGGGAVKKGNYKDQIELAIAGGRYEQLRFLGSIRPVRLLSHPRLRDCWEGVQVSQKSKQFARVKKVTAIGVGPVVGLETSTKTFIGDGLLQHNTTNYPERLDRRIVARPRRFDRVIKVDAPNAKIRAEFLKAQLPKVKQAELKTLIAKTEGLSLAGISEMIISVYCLGNNLDDTITILKALAEGAPSSSEFENKGAIGFASDFGKGSKDDDGVEPDDD